MIFLHYPTPRQEAMRYSEDTLGGVRQNTRSAFVHFFDPEPQLCRSTGRLCIELGIILAGHRTLITGGLEELPPPDSIQALHDLESRVVASLAFEEWYSLCGHCLAHSRVPDTSMPGEITLGAIIRCPSGCQFEDTTEIVRPVPGRGRGLRLGAMSWYCHPRGFCDERFVMLREDGSIRYV
jgi:hypothetical protein